MMIAQRSTAAAGMAVALLLVMSGCGSSSESGNTDGNSKARSLNAEFIGNPTSFDPAVAAGADDYVANSLLFSSLLSLDDGGELVGNLASEWEAESASKYIFTIRKDATCADGTAITPSVVAASMQYLADDKTGDHLFAPLIFGKGAPEITGDDQANTVIIKTAEPYTNLLPAVSISQSGIICPAGLADIDGLGAGKVKGAFSGPYTLDEAKPGVSFTFRLRDEFQAWPDFEKPLEGRPAPELVFSLRTDPATSANKVLSGDLDISGLSGTTLDRFQGDSFNKVDAVVANIFVMFNERSGHVFAGNADARKAVGQAIDRPAFNTVFSNGVSPLFNSVVPDSYACALNDDSLVEQLDPAAAAKVLAGVKINFVASTAFGDQGKGAEYIQKVLSNAGAEVNLNTTDNATWVTEIGNPSGGWDMTIMGDINALNVTSASLDRVMGPALEDGGRNFGAVDNAAGAAALSAGLATVDEAEKCKQYTIAQTTMLERDDVVPLAGLVATYLSPKDVKVRAPGGRINYATSRNVAKSS